MEAPCANSYGKVKSRRSPWVKKIKRWPKDEGNSAILSRKEKKKLAKNDKGS